MAGVTGVDAMLGELRTITTARTQSGAWGTIPTSRRGLPFLAVISHFVMGPGGISRFLRSACQLRSHDRYVTAGFILFVPEVFAGVSGVVPSRRGRTGNRGGHPKEARRFHASHLQNRA